MKLNLVEFKDMSSGKPNSSLPLPKERNPLQWKRFTFDSLSRLDAEFKENDLGELGKGRKPAVEFFRQLPNGLYISHSYIRRPYLSFKQKDQAPKYEYQYGFAVLFSLRPFLGHHGLPADQIGTRFDFNHSPAAWFASRELRKKIDEIEPLNQTTLKLIDEKLTDAFTLCEQTVLPFYLEILSEGKSRILEAFELGFKLATSSKAEKKSSIAADGYQGDLSAFELAKGLTISADSKGRYNPNAFAIQRSDFFKDRLPESEAILKTLSRL